MSRIGSKPVPLANGVTASFNDGVLRVVGPLGEEEVEIAAGFTCSVEDQLIRVLPSAGAKDCDRGLWGLCRSLVANAALGVSEGFSIKVTINGVGYRAALDSGVLMISLGFSHGISFMVPDGIQVEVPAQNIVVIKGTNKQFVGAVAACIRSLRPPEPYKGKGVIVGNETILRKEGKR